jgi:hypothetical protein
MDKCKCQRLQRQFTQRRGYLYVGFIIERARKGWKCAEEVDRITFKVRVRNGALFNKFIDARVLLKLGVICVYKFSILAAE